MTALNAEAVSERDLATFHRVLGQLRALPVDDRQRRHAEHAAASFVRDGKKRRARIDSGVDADAALAAATALGDPHRREDAALTEVSGTVGEFDRPRRCYVCKIHYRSVDAFYHMLCPGCAADNAARRELKTDLSGRRVLLTGGRVKIGFQLALMLLRDGAEVHVTTRFPRDARRRFAAVAGSRAWWDRLRIIGIDLRDPRQVLGLCERLRTDHNGLDIIVNNAAQTIRRPPEAYAALDAAETGQLPPGVSHAPGFRGRAALTSTTAAALDTVGLTESGLLPDARPHNSWSVTLGSIDPAELLEAQLVNAFAPALLCDRLLPLLRASAHPRRYIVNVSAVEGRFAVRHKMPNHPHTNMAKAALNMLTRTSASGLAAENIFMCSVDTGWITDENPEPRKSRIAAKGFRTPLDVVDGAARVYDPIVRGEAGSPVAGVFLKDYREVAW